MKYYIGDMHFRHKNVLKLDGRPWNSMEEMESELIRRWNSVVKHRKDIVYCLGDFCWSGKYEDWKEIVDQLNGQIHLILGNHEGKRINNKIKDLFYSADYYDESKENGLRVCVCHYPIPFHNGAFYSHSYDFYGHVHNTNDQKILQKYQMSIWNNMFEAEQRGEKYVGNQGQFINVGCMMPWMDYTPRAFEEITQVLNSQKETFFMYRKNGFDFNELVNKMDLIY